MSVGVPLTQAVGLGFVRSPPWGSRTVAETGNIVPGLILHNNPVVRGLVTHPGDWPWSSWRFYYREDRSLLAMDHPH